MFTSLDLPSWLIWTVVVVVLIILCIAIIPWLKRFLQVQNPYPPSRAAPTPVIGLEGRHADRDRGKIKIRSSDLMELEALISKLVCSINDAGHLLRKGFT